ncbi:MAG: hypothetical protein SWO11_06330 [Thermodesulfobacteriota bacterium]|nr:hypothetical protein [Thermodesulfobacteriota bacterium]
MKLKGSHIWLFAFADLAFLLLIAFTQVPHADIQKMLLPKIPPSSNRESIDTSLSYKLFVHPPSEELFLKNPFEIVSSGEKEDRHTGDLLSEKQLKRRLENLSEISDTGPILWPHPSSQSEDMLIAYTHIKHIWPNSEVIIAVMPEESIEEIAK